MSAPGRGWSRVYKIASRHSATKTYQQNQQSVFSLSRGSHAILNAERGIAVNLPGAGMLGLVREPRMHARSKTNKPFHINNTVPKNRAYMRGYSPKLALIGTERSNSQHLSGEFRLFLMFSISWALFGIFRSRPHSGPQNKHRRFQSQFNLMSQLPLALEVI
jgi:hypothetical protein